jgi:hypothetical protein
MPIQYEMPKSHFKSVIRQIKKSRLDQVKILRIATHAALKRWGVRRNLKRAVKGIPDGSDQQNFGSVIGWIKKIPGKSDVSEKAVNQVIAIDATCVVRCGG